MASRETPHHGRPWRATRVMQHWCFLTEGGEVGCCPGQGLPGCRGGQRDVRRVEGKWGRTLESEREMAVRGRREDECAKSVERRRCRVSTGSHSGACWTSVSVSTVEPQLVTKPAGPGRLQLRLLRPLSPAPLGSRVRRAHVAGACTVPKTLQVAEEVARPAAPEDEPLRYRQPEQRRRRL